MIRVALIYGGPSHEHDVSIISARSVLKNIPEGFDVTPVYLNKQHLWVFNPPEGDIVEDPFERLRQFDIVFPLIHGNFGEDGKLQGYLEAVGVPYVGPGVLTSALSMDKDLTKRIARSINVPVADSITVFEQLTGADKLSISEQFTYPVFVKPANAGSSVGVSCVSNESELEAAFSKAAVIDRKVLIEQGVKGREIEIGVLEEHGVFSLSEIGEIRTGSEFYDYEAKYQSEGKTELIVSPDLPEHIVSTMHSYAIDLSTVLGVKGLSRLDFFYDEAADRLIFNEINTLPGFTAFSMYPSLFKAKGMTYSKLIERLVRSALPVKTSVEQ
jgi:D-alanine-D-alanine ligase